MYSVISLICWSKRGSSSVLDCISLASYRPALNNSPRIYQLPILNKIVVDAVGIFEMEYGDCLIVRIDTSELVLYLKKCGAIAHLSSHVRSVVAEEMLVRLQNVRQAHLEALVDVRRPNVSTYGVNP